MDDLLSCRVRVSPDFTALIDATTDHLWTYTDLDSAVDRIAGQLAGLGVSAGDRVGILMETRPEFVYLVLAVSRLGGVIVPFNARLSSAELTDQIRGANLFGIVCEAETEEAILQTSVPVTVFSVDEPQNTTVEALKEVEPIDIAPVVREHDDLAVVMYTSGTTGDPKAVRLTHRNFIASATTSAFRLGVSPADRWCCPLSMYHMGGLSVVVRSIFYGTTTVLTGEFDAEHTLNALYEYDCSGVSLVPTMLKRLLKTGDLPETLRFVLVGGAPTPRELIKTCQARDVPIFPSYGMTETTSQIATALPREVFDNPNTVGRPLLLTKVTVVDEESGEPLPNNEIGELVVAGPTVTPGYADPKHSDQSFGPFGLHTGDIGYLSNRGYLHVLNRQSDEIITGGENVHPGQVSEVLRQHPSVDDVVVMGISDPSWGERVAALVVANEGEITADDIDTHCRQYLADYKCPRTIFFTTSLPRTTSGTVDRDTAREYLIDANDI